MEVLIIQHKMETDKLDAVRNRLKMEDELETKKRLKEKEEVIYSNKAHENRHGHNRFVGESSCSHGLINCIQGHPAEALSYQRFHQNIIFSSPEPEVQVSCCPSSIC